MYAVGPVSRVKPVRMPSIVSSTSTDFSPSAPPPGNSGQRRRRGGALRAAPAVAGTGLLRRAPASRTQRGQVRRRPPASASKCVRPRERTTLVPNASASDLDIRPVCDSRVRSCLVSRWGRGQRYARARRRTRVSAFATTCWLKKT